MRVARTARRRAVFSRRVGGIVRGVVVWRSEMKMSMRPVLIDIEVQDKGVWFGGRSE